MNLIAQLLPLSNVITELDAGSKKSVFEQVGQLFENNLHIARSEVSESLLIREKLGSTGLGQGVAIPHGRIKGLGEAAAALIRMKKPIPFDAPDGKPVSLICALLVPEKATDLHLQILSELAQMFSDKNFREGLLTSKDQAEIHRLIYNWTPNVPDQHRTVI
ncbi:MAG: PTS sugar transporter subunit IIA [Nitrosospira sp.]|jgi:nitrogen PTS system EIIA component